MSGHSLRRRPINQYASEPVKLVLATHQSNLGPRIAALSRWRRSRHIFGVTTAHASRTPAPTKYFERELNRDADTYSMS
jgi:hypothetical protein